MDERWRHLQTSVVLTLLLIALTEVVHHYLRIDETASAGVFLLSLVPVAYGALRGGFVVGAANSLLLALYVTHYTGPHETIASTSGASLRSFGVILALGLAMSWPMSVIRQRERRFRAALEARTAALERRNEELTELNMTLESFGYVVSHDLKEPVRAIENYLAAAKEEWGKGESARFVDEAHRANQRLARMLQGLLEYSRASNAPTTLRRLSVEEVVRGEACRAQYEPLFEERHAALEVEPGLPPVRADEILLAQLLGNLLLNAARHNTLEKPVIRIRAANAPPGRVHLVIEDNGAGFPPEVLVRFARLPAVGAATVKKGFGLVIAQRAARRLEGSLWLENGATGGAQAHVELAAAGSAPAGPIP